MRDPNPSNISGEKVQQHIFKHSINWGHVALAVAIVLIAWKVLPAGASDDQEENQDPSVGLFAWRGLPGGASDDQGKNQDPSVGTGGVTDD